MTLSGGSVIGLILISAVLGGMFAMGAGILVIDELHIIRFEGGGESGPGFLGFVLLLFGLAAGALTGLVTGLVAQSGFWRAQGSAAVVLAGLAIAGMIACAVFQTEGPKLDGENLALQIELESPPGWTPDRSRAGQENNVRWLQPGADDDPKARPDIGTVRMRRTDDGRWLASSSFDLTDTRSHRYARIQLGNTVNVSLNVPLPRHPTAQDKQWSAWSGAGFYAQKDAPVPHGFTWRFRVQTVSEDRREFPDPEKQAEALRRERLAGLRREDPMLKWLPLFEGPNGQPDRPPDPEATQSLLGDKVGELAQLLRSPDPDVRRQAVYAVACFYPKVPESLLEPLAAAGEHTVDLIGQAVTSNRDEPDLAAERRVWNYFMAWQTALDQSGKESATVFRPALENIERAARQFESGANAGAQPTDIGKIGEFARRDLDALAATK